VTYRDRPIECPRCGVELVRHEVAERWKCGRCKGVLVGVGEVARELVEVAPELAPDGPITDLTTIGRRTTAAPLACPACASLLEPVFLGGVEVDRCYHDQLLWFDAGELPWVLDIARERHDATADPWLVRVMRHLFGEF
jgi:Zn-finger nucleic acid-binding protein